MLCHDWHLFLIGCVALRLGAVGWSVRRERWHCWLLWHGVAMPGSYTALLPDSYVDDGPQLPLWNWLPFWCLWILPTTVDVPLSWLALGRNHAPHRPSRGRGQFTPVCHPRTQKGSIPTYGAGWWS